MIAPGAGALWVGLMMAAAGEPSLAAPAPTPTERPAPSPSSIVGVRRPPLGDSVLTEAGSRLRSELAAMGLEGQFVDCPPTETDPGACPDAQATATISLARRDDGIVEIGVRTILSDGLELSRHVRVLARDGGDDPAVLAVRAVELLRDLRLTGQRPAPRGPRGPARDDEDPPSPPPPPPPPPGWTLSTGVALLGSPRGDQPGVGPAFGLTIGVGKIIGPHLLVVASFAGPFNTSLGPYDGRSAALVQALAVLELRFRLQMGPFEPFAAVLTGINYLQATVPGSVEFQAPPADNSAWVPMFGVAVGGCGSFLTRFFVCLEAAAFVTQPDMYVQIDSQIIGATGAPSTLLSSSVGLTLP